MDNVALDDASIGGLVSNWLDRGWEARLLVDERLKLLWNNGAAASWLDEATCPIRLNGGTLEAKDHRLHSRLAAMIANCRRETSAMLLGDGEGRQELLFSAREVGRFGGFQCSGLAVRRVMDTDIRELVGVGDAFNLTRSEEAVLQQMVLGFNVEKIALSSSTSPETVRTHVRRAYSKMRVSSREEMFSRLRPFLFDR